MTRTLEGCREKIARAEQHMRDLDMEWSTWIKSSPQAFKTHYRVDETGQLLEVDVIFEGPTPPIMLGVILGDLVHDLRSALDHIAWTIIPNRDALCTKQQRRIRFPTTDSREAFAREEIVAHTSEHARALLEGCQLYEPGNDALGVLQRLWVADKHRAIAVAATLPDRNSILGAVRHKADTVPLRRRLTIPEGRPVEPNTQVAALVFPANGVHPQVVMEGELSLQPAFQDDTCAELQIRTADLIEYVARTVQTFAPLLLL